MNASARALVGVVVAALATLGAAEWEVRRLNPPRKLIEVDDGMAEYERSDPDVLVFGSSHSRSFAPLRELLAPTGQAVALMALEDGRFVSFDWLLRHRLAPLIDEKLPDGTRKRKRLAHLIFDTTYWEGCALSHIGPPTNLPARAWTLSDFLGDFARHGLTDYNRNYLSYRAGLLLPSTMFVNHGVERFAEELHLKLRFSGGEAQAEERDRRRDDRQALERGMLDKAIGHCNDPVQLDALNDVLDYFLSRGVDATVVEFPLEKGIVSPRAREQLIGGYHDYLVALARRKPVRVADWTLRSPLGMDDFEDDMDHVTPSGNRKLMAWALEHDLAFLKTPAAR